MAKKRKAKSALGLILQCKGHMNNLKGILLMQVSTYSPYASTLSQNASAFSQSNQLQTASTRPNNVTADTLMFGAKYTYDKNKERKVRQVINNHNLTSAHVRLTRNKVIVTINSDEAETFTNGMK